MASSPWEIESTNGGGGDYKIPPEGNHPSALVGLIDLGTHDGNWQGKALKNHKVLLAWELTADHKDDGSSYIIMKEFNIQDKASKKNQLRLLMEAWRGKPYGDKETLNILGLLGQKCLINIGHDKSKSGSDFAKILGVTPLPRGMDCPKPLCELYEWHIGSGKPFMPPEWLPWHYGKPVADHIEESDEMKRNRVPVGAGVGPGSPVNEVDDDIPF